METNCVQRAGPRRWEETSSFSKDSVIRFLMADDREVREDMRLRKVCGDLKTYHIAHAAIAEVRHPAKVVRMRQGGTFFLATLRGAGRIWVDGMWKRCEAGQAALLPPFSMNAFETIPGEEWEYCHIRYEEAGHHAPILSSKIPALGAFPTEAFSAAMTGLFTEAEGTLMPGMARSWLELVHRYVMAFAERWKEADRLGALWERVSAAPAEHWSMKRLSKEAGISGEHVRRLCVKEIGRSPMRQVAFLRMRKAAELLSTSSYKTEAIAHMVGYADSSIFSKVFRKWTGLLPSEHRRMNLTRTPES